MEVKEILGKPNSEIVGKFDIWTDKEIILWIMTGDITSMDYWNNNAMEDEFHEIENALTTYQNEHNCFLTMECNLDEQEPEFKFNYFTGMYADLYRMTVHVHKR